MHLAPVVEISYLVCQVLREEEEEEESMDLMQSHAA